MRFLFSLNIINVIPFFCVLAAITLAVSGCSTAPLTSHKLSANSELNKSTWLAHKKALSQIEKWQIKGRFSAKTDTENWTGSIIWHQDKQQYKINISGPLSTGSILLEGDDNIARLQLSKDRFASDTNPQSLLYDHTGLKLPVKDLKYWLLGIPHPNNTNSTIELNQNGQLSKLNQNNWEVTFKRYTDVNNLQLPNKIFLINHEINVRLIIQQWHINS